ncbi:MAG: amidase [Thermomicrobiales bacterium]
MTDQITNLPAHRLATMIRDRDLSSIEVVETHLERIAEVNPALNAVVQVTADEAMAAARSADERMASGDIDGPLHGVPFTVKDNIPVAGVVMTNGTLGMKDFVPDEHATVVKRLKAAGGIVLGKTNLPEIGMAGESDNLVYGRTNNPYDLDRTPGGSSGGESAIIAAGGSPLGIGTDIGGSIRYPAHCCGIAGIKPTMGRIPWHVPYGYTDELRQSGPMARSVADLILALPLMAGADWQDPSAPPVPVGNPHDVTISSLRLAVYADNGVITPVDEIVQAVDRAASALRESGASVEENRPAELDKTMDLFGRLLGASGGQQYLDALEAAGTTDDQISPMIRRFLDDVSNAAVSTADFQRTILEWDQHRSVIWGFFEKYDAVICPVNSHPAPLHGTGSEHGLGLSYTAAYNIAGLPGAVVRAGQTEDGVPVGVQIVSRAWREDIALAIALELENRLGGWQPPTI